MAEYVARAVIWQTMARERQVELGGVQRLDTMAESYEIRQRIGSKPGNWKLLNNSYKKNVPAIECGLCSNSPIHLTQSSSLLYSYNN